MRNLTVVFWVFLPCVFLIACGPFGNHSKDTVGKDYINLVSEVDKQDTLTLYESGSYVRKTGKEDRHVIDAGTWSWTNRRDRIHVTRWTYDGEESSARLYVKMKVDCDSSLTCIQAVQNHIDDDYLRIN